MGFARDKPPLCRLSQAKVVCVWPWPRISLTFSIGWADSKSKAAIVCSVRYNNHTGFRYFVSSLRTTPPNSEKFFVRNASFLFCDPALLEQPMLVSALDQQNIPHTQFKYSENTGQFAVIREQAGTFSDSIRLWSET